MAQGLLRVQQVAGNRLKQTLSQPRLHIHARVYPAEGNGLLTPHPRLSLGVHQNRRRATLAQLEVDRYEPSTNTYPTSNAKVFEWIDTPSRKADSNQIPAEVNPAKEPNSPAQSLSQDESSIPVKSETEPSKDESQCFWSAVPQWSDITPEDFNSQYWQTRNSVDKKKIERFLLAVLPSGILPPSENPLLQHIRTKDDFIQEAKAALEMAPMTIKLSPYILSCINWNDPLNDPIRLQFIPLKSGIIPDHSSLTLDSLGEEEDSPVPGLVHRYPGKVLFLSTSICPVYCSFCTRAYAVGPETSSTDKKPQKPSKERWENMFKYIENDESIKDVVVSGGDTYMLAPDHLKLIGERLLSIGHVRRFRIASKGLAVNPCRILDDKDAWASTLVDLAKKGRELGKQVCWHTHFNHPNEITWVTKKAALRLCQQGLVIRNQSVLLKGVNDDAETMGTLIKTLADMNIEPYYVYICDLVKGVEHLRTPLRTLLNLDKELRGTLTGFMMPDFVVDLPGGGGKRLAHTFETYNEKTGVSTWRAPGLPDIKGQQTYTYYDPSPWEATKENVLKMRQQQDLMHKHRSTRLADLENPENQDVPEHKILGSCTSGTGTMDAIPATAPSTASSETSIGKAGKIGEIFKPSGAIPPTVIIPPTTMSSHTVSLSAASHSGN